MSRSEDDLESSEIRVLELMKIIGAPESEVKLGRMELQM